MFFVVFSAVITVQLFYYIYFFSRLAWYKKPEKKVNQEYPVSVVICAKDEAGNLVKSLPGILVQNYQSTNEIILVDDNSEDDTKYLLEEFQKSFKNLKVLTLTQDAKLSSGKKFPLSMGIRAAKYEILLLTDADCTPASENWIQKMQDGYAENIDIVLGYGAYRKLPGLLNKLIRFETFHTALQYLSYALAGQTYMGVGRNLSYKREVFLKNKGFSAINHIPGGDDDLFIHKIANKNNTAIVIDNEAFTVSEPKRTWKEWRSQKFRHYTTAKYYLPKFKFLLGLYSFTGFLVYPLLICALVWHGKIIWLPLIPFALRLIVMSIVWRKSMAQLDVKDLWPMTILWDLWMCLYYLLFLPSLWIRPSRKWK